MASASVPAALLPLYVGRGGFRGDGALPFRPKIKIFLNVKLGPKSVNIKFDISALLPFSKCVSATAWNFL